MMRVLWSVSSGKTRVRCHVALWCISLSVDSIVSLAVSGLSIECDKDQLVVYNIVMETFWDREKFPRQYPEWRPPAQWAKLLGELSRVILHDTVNGCRYVP